MSSGFKENFGRGESDDLGYDDSAFYYFGLAFLLIGLIPSTYYLIISPILYGEYQINYKAKNCKCTHCADRMEKRASLYRYTWLNPWFLVKLAIFSGLWYMCFVCFNVVKDIEPLKTFIPHEILGVTTDATIAEIKKAYRKLSREKHPDKNPDNPEAVNEFIQITKAYTVSIVAFFESDPLFEYRRS